MSDLEREHPMTEPTKPASGSDPKTSEKEAARIRDTGEDIIQCLIGHFGITANEEQKIYLHGMLAAYASSREAANEKLIGELVEALEISAIIVHYGRFHQFHLFEMCEAVECIDARELLARARGGQKK